MLGIVHHSPVIISVLIDRSLFKNQIVNEEEATSGSWKQKVGDFKKSSANNRERVLFIEKVECLQAMLRGGFDPSPFKVVLYDDSKILGQIEGVDIVDAKFQGDTWQLYKLMPEKFNKALRDTGVGIVESIRDVDVKELEPDVPAPPKAKKTRARPVMDSAAAEEAPEETTEEDAAPEEDTAPMADADAVMASILDGAAKESVDSTAEEVIEAGIDVAREAEAAATEAVGDQAAEEFADAANGAEAEPEEPASEPVAEPKTPSKSKPEKEPVESHKLF